MKKIILILLSPFVLFATQINFDKTFYKNVTADKLSTNITIKVTRQNQNEINPILNKYNDIIKNDKKVSKKRGNFSIAPKYIYKNNISRIVAYNGNLSYEVSSFSYEDINEFITSILDEKDERDLSIVISSLSWKVSDKLKEKLNNDLRLEAITWSSKYANTLSNETSSNCKVNEININQNSYSRPRAMMSRALSSDSNVAIPQQSKNKISLSANYNMECK